MRNGKSGDGATILRNSGICYNIGVYMVSVQKLKVHYLICIMNTQEAKDLNMKILGSKATGPYAGKCLVKMQAWFK